MLKTFIGILFFTFCALQSGAQKNISIASQGAVISLQNEQRASELVLGYKKIIQPGPQFLISDDPEYIKIADAIAMQENVQPGSVRLYLYNVNGIKEKVNTKIIPVIKNMGNDDMHLRFIKFASHKPTENYFLTAKKVLYDYFSSSAIHKEVVTIKPGEIFAIDSNHEKNIAKFNELVHGIYEFTIDQPGQVSVVQTDLKSSPEQVINNNTVLQKAGNAGRGLFGVSNYKIIVDTLIDTKNGLSQLTVADNKVDKWIESLNEDGKVIRNIGNYGVIYDIEMKWRSSDGKGLALVIYNPYQSSTSMCRSMATAMFVSEGKFKKGPILLPSDRLNVKGIPQGVLVQIFTPSKRNEIQTIKFKYSPPGAACLPTPFLMIPVDIN